ncbi:MAG: YggT family protein [Defluviicoccus sp.]|nr:YggT family protein [Defluviicoccus sp.]MDE0276343.1 YggT family protein [Defluviicoccus sp.]
MHVILGPILEIVDTILGLYMWVIILSVVMSWLYAFNVVNTSNRFVYAVGYFTHRLTEPALAPIRRFLPNIGAIDISPLVLLLAVFFLRRVIQNLMFELGG